eukprot:4305169-Prymnesium_polylepis.1
MQWEWRAHTGQKHGNSGRCGSREMGRMAWRGELESLPARSPACGRCRTARSSRRRAAAAHAPPL